jgi:hypothetical protein
MFALPRRIATAAISLWIFSGCEEAPKAAVPPVVTVSASAPSVAVDAGAPRVVGALRKNVLDLGTRALPAESIAFTDSEFVHLTQSTLFINELPSQKEVAKVPVVEPRRLLLLRNGSTLALCAAETIVVTERKRKVMRLRRIPLFPQSQVMPDLHRPRRFWVLHAFDAALYGYELDDDKLEMLEPRDIKDFDGRVFAPLRDGSFVHTDKDGLVRLFLAGKRERQALDVAGVFRLLPTRRLDQVWLAHDGGKLERVQLLGGRAKRLLSFQLDDVFDVATSDKHLAALRVQRTDAGRHFAVELYTAQGKRVWSDSVELNVEAPESDGWVARVSRDRGLALSQNGKWLAVGGLGAAVLWDATKGTRVFKR